MNISIHSLYWDNGSVLKDLNKSVTDHFNLSVNYHHLDGVPHGFWMNEIIKCTNSDIIGFFDIDCVPTNKKIVEDSINFVIKYDTFIGIAQTSNHIPPCSHIFVAPAFFFISRNCYKRLGSPSFSETFRSDVAEEVSYRAEEKGISYRAIYPTHYERPSTEGVWNLGNYGKFAIGTHFNGGIYHLYQGRYRQNIELFSQRCSQIINGNFTTNGMISSTEF